jgi:hypothetical protein
MRLEPSPHVKRVKVNALPKVVDFLRVARFPPTGKVDRVGQPRTQALFTTRLAGGKTLVQAGHVSPRFWEITTFLHKGGG